MVLAIFNQKRRKLDILLKGGGRDLHDNNRESGANKKMRLNDMRRVWETSFYVVNFGCQGRDLDRS